LGGGMPLSEGKVLLESARRGETEEVDFFPWVERSVSFFSKMEGSSNILLARVLDERDRKGYSLYHELLAVSLSFRGPLAAT